MPMDIGKNESNDGGVEEVAETLNFCNALNERVYLLFLIVFFGLKFRGINLNFELTD